MPACSWWWRIPAAALDPKLTGPIDTQPANEVVSPQKLLPQVRDELWAKLVKCKLDYDEDKGTYSIHVTPEVKALDGKTITVRGFVLPMDGSDRTKHFLISRNTPVCMYCPPGQPNEVVEVQSQAADRLVQPYRVDHRQAQPDQRRRAGAVFQDRERRGEISRAQAASRLFARATVSPPDQVAQVSPSTVRLRA